MYKQVAVIGMSGRFPSANSIAEFCENLKTGSDHVTDMSFQRLAFSGSSVKKNYLPQGTIENIDQFDCEFFNILPGEAKLIDPQQRLLLEVVYEAIEDAGYDVDSFAGTDTIVLVGDIQSQYFNLPQEHSADALIATGNVNANTAGRISRYFKLTGKAAMIDTACSSSLVALHDACNHLMLGQCTHAIVCGVNLNLFPVVKGSSKIGILSPEGIARPFDAMADGTAIGEAAVCVLLKLHENAVKDGDNIHCVIRGTAVNQDAHRSTSLSSPSSVAQAEVLSRTWADTQINPEHITYLEAHGTGTRLGDPLEIEGINMAFKKVTTKNNFCSVSSVKGNIGHCSSAAGLVGLVKAIMALKEKVLFPSANFNRLNPFIDLSDSPVYINTELRPWKTAQNIRRIAGISSFGFSGTNCHVVIEEANTTLSINNTRRHPPPYLIVLSGKTKNALKQNAERLMNHIDCNRDVNIFDLSGTLATCRKHYEFRYLFLAADLNSAKQQLHADIGADNFSSPSTLDSVWFCFSGDSIITHQEIKYFLSEHNTFYTDYQSVVREAEGNPQMDDVIRFAGQYSLFRLFQKLGVVSKNLIGTGVGKAAISVIKGQVTIREALQKIADNKYAEIANMTGSLEHFVTRELIGNTCILELGQNGSISESIKMLATKNGKNITVFNIGAIENNIMLLDIATKLHLLSVGIRWKEFYPAGSFTKVSLPGYAFQRERCWIFDPLKAAGYEPLNWMYRVRFVHEANQWQAAKNRFHSVKRNILICAGSGGLGSKFAHKLTERGHNCVIVEFGETFHKKESNIITINPENTADYTLLKNHLANVDIGTVFHFEDVNNHGQPDPHEIDRLLNIGVYHKYLLYKCLEQKLQGERLTIVHISKNGQLIGNKVSITGHLGFSFFKALLREFPDSAFRSIDIQSEEQDDTICQHVDDELNSDLNCISIAYRNRERLVPRLEKVSFGEFSRKLIVKKEGVYVITGGLSGIGFEISKYYLLRQKCTIIIIGRKSNDHPDTTTRMRSLKDINLSGSTILYYSNDIGNEIDSRKLMTLLNRDFPRIDGVIHSAGTFSKADFADLKMDDIQELAKAKIHGSINLYEGTRNHRLDYFILFSSVNTLLPEKRTIGYTIANAFEDAYAKHLSNHGVNAISINWGDWGEIRSKVGGVLYEEDKMFVFPWDNNQGVQAFELGMCLQYSNMIIANLNVKYLVSNPFFRVEGEEDEEYVDHDGHLSETERKLMKVWKSVLRLKNLGVDDNFFKIGGHSIIGTQLINRIDKEFNVRLSMRELLEIFPTIRLLAGHLDAVFSVQKLQKKHDIVRIENAAHYDLSYGQRGIWLAHHSVASDAMLNLVIALTGQFDPQIVQKSIDLVMQRHDILRTNISMIDYELRQVVSDVRSDTFKVVEANGMDACMKELEKEIRLGRNLQTDNLFHCTLVCNNSGPCLLTLNFHHIIADGISVQNFLKEFYHCYRATGAGDKILLNDLSIQYKDYAHWHNNYLRSDRAQNDMEYWQTQLRDVESVEIKTDYPRAALKSAAGERLDLSLGLDISNQLRDFSKRLNLSVFTTLVTLVKMLVVKEAGEGTVALGIQYSGRSTEELQLQLGYYINTLVLVDEINASDCFLECLQKVKKTFMDALDHSNYPFQLLVEKFYKKGRSAHRNPFFDIEVNLDESLSERFTSMNADLDFQFLPIPSYTSRYDLSLNFVNASSMSASLEYNSDLYKRSSMEVLAIKFLRLVDIVLANPAKKISDIALHTIDQAGLSKTVLHENF